MSLELPLALRRRRVLRLAFFLPLAVLFLGLAIWSYVEDRSGWTFIFGMVGFFITRAARLQMDRDMVQALKAGDAPES